jgi:protein-S-isoprenylcysteine O-methyltransferase Ste14
MKLIIPPPVQGLITGGAMWLIAQQIPALSFSVSFQAYLAGGLIAVGLLIELIAVAAFLKAKTTVTPLQPSKTKTLVIDGLYRFSRNPMYLGLAILLTGWMIWLGNPINLILLAGFIAYMTAFQIKPEEAALREKFSAEYDAYCRRVRRWI